MIENWKRTADLVRAARDEGRIEGAAVGAADLEAAERRGMERAAVIADTHGAAGDPSEYHRTAQNNVAAAIRADMEDAK